MNSLARQPFRAAKAARRTTLAAVNIRRRNRLPDAVPPPAPFSAPYTPFNVAIDARRRFAFTEVPLDEVKMVKNALGGTVNDVVLALCAGALRNYLLGKGLLPEKGLVAMVPISVRSDDEKSAMGNRVSSMLTGLATDIEDPVERLHLISAGTRHAKDQDKAIGADTLTDWAEFAAPALAARAARLYSNTKVADRMRRPLFNVTISNVPGPPFPIYCAGSRMAALYPSGPIGDGLALTRHGMRPV